ncbi:putative RNA-directed DNA polymerase from transposon X-element [Trichonephila clavipes]|nr:putative RNA-directed DNA polymerase from transposon X-element [Trichonephila clavipes]
MKITKTYREQVDMVKKIFPHLRLKTTGEYIKLYSNTTEQNRIVRQTLKGLGYYFYVITPKNERPIKVVLKGYPKAADPNDNKSDLEKEGFLPKRVTQLIGRRSKQKLPVFQVTLPRTMEDLKIFDLKTLVHLNITVDGYNGKGITQCFSCNNFHHNAENCFLKSRCLKCGEEHLTKDCPIKQRLETKFCINCQVYGHMANWYGCPCFPKPPKGAAKINRNSYTNLYNSFVRPNFSYAQVAKNSTNARTNVNSEIKQQMAPRRPETSSQTEAVNNVPPIHNQVENTTPIINSNPTPNLSLNIQNRNNSDIKALLSTTVQYLIQLLNSMNTAPTLTNSFDQVNSAQADANQMYSLIEASYIENLIQTSSNCVLFGDFNAPHTTWNCKNNSSRGVRLLDFTNLTNLHIAYLDSPTRFGINTANTLDIAIIRNFYYPFTINSLHDLSSDHNPVLLNFTLKLNKDITNPRAVHTNWPLFSKKLNTKLSLLNYHPNSIKTDSDIDQKITEFTDTVRAAHSRASRPIEMLHKCYTPPYIHKLIKQKNQYRNLYHRTLDPHYKTLYNKAQKNVKKELRNYSNENWTARLQALSTQDNSLWAVQKLLKNKRSDIPPLNCTTGTAVTDNQKANILADSILDNFTENTRNNNDFDDDDELINNTVNSFLSIPPLTTTETA